MVLNPVLAFSSLLPPSGTVLSRLNEAWAHVALGLSAIITEEIAPVVGGFAVQQGHLMFSHVVAACAIGVWCLALGSYAIGHYNRAWVRLSIRRRSKTVKRLMGAMRSRPWRSSVASRFAFGARIAFSMACGASRVPFGIYAAGSAIGAVIWAVVFTGLGWFFGESAVLVVGHVRRYEDAIVALLVVAGVVGYLVVRRRRDRVERS